MQSRPCLLKQCGKVDRLVCRLTAPGCTDSAVVTVEANSSNPVQGHGR